MPQNMSNFDNVLQDYFDPGIKNTLNSEVTFFKHLEETDKEWSGRRVIFPVHTTRSPGVGARADGGTLPSATNQGYSLAVVSATYQYGRIQLTGPVMRSSQHAWATAMSEEVSRMADDMANDLGRQSWGTGDGRLAQVGVAASATAVSLYNRYFEPGQPGARYLYVNQQLDFGTVASPNSLGAAVRVQAIQVSQNPATTTDVLNVSGTYAGVSQCETFLFVRDAGGAGIEMNGALGLIDVVSEANMWGSSGFMSQTVMNINRTTTPGWNSLVLGNSGTARIIDGNLMQQAFDRIHAESGKKVDFIMGEHNVIRAFLDSVSADRRYQTNVFDAGYSKLTYNGVPLVVDRQAPYNSLLVMHKSAIKLYTLLDGEWADDDGAILSRVQNQDAYEAYYRRYGNIGLSDNPKAACFIRDIRVDF